ncbi:type I polyketide synthase [Nocardia thraciensis]
MMEPILDEFAAVVAEIPLRPPRIPIVSTITGQIESELFTDPSYWVRHVHDTVRFADGITAACAAGGVRFLEVGPDAALAPMISRTLGDTAAVVPAQRRGRDQVRDLIRCLGTGYCHGAEIDGQRFYADSGARTVELPTYAFQRRRYWHSSAAPTIGETADPGVRRVDHPFLSSMVAVAGSGETVVNGRISLGPHPWLADHAVLGTMLLPGAAHVEMASAAAASVGCTEVRELVSEIPLALEPDVDTEVQVVLGAPDAAGQRSIAIHARPDFGADRPVDWMRHAVGTVGSPNSGRTAAELGAEAWPPSDAVEVSVPDLYATLAGAGFEYGAGFRTARRVWRRGDEIYVESALPGGTGNAGFGAHPALFDGVFHGVMAAVDTVDNRSLNDEVLVPFAFRGVQVHRRGAATVRARLRMARNGVEQLVAHDESGRVAWTMTGLDVRRANAAALRPTGRIGGAELYDIDWVPVTARLELAGAVWGVGDPTAWNGRSSGVVERWFPDVAAVTAALDTGTGAPTAVVLPCGTADGPGTTAEVATGARDAVLDVLKTLQEWMVRPGLLSVRLVVVTRGAVSASAAGDGPLDPRGLVQAAVTGLVRSTQLEYPGRVVLVDAGAGVSVDSALGTIVGGVESELLVRDSGVWAPRLAAVGAAKESARGAPEWGRDGVVLVAGAGELGGVVVRHLVADGEVRRVVLASRSGGGAELAAELAAFGARIDCVACDLTDPGEVRRLVAQVSDWGPLTAVVYTAGVLDDGVVASLSPERVVPVLRAKIDGAWSLHEATRDLGPLDFVLFSSVAGTAGAPGQANYAAANAFLDALAQYRRGLGLAGISIGWGLWDVSGGMAGGVAAADRARLGRGGLAGLSVPEGLRLWDRALAGDRSRVVAARFDHAGLSNDAARLAGVVPSVMRGMARGAGEGALLGAATDASAELVSRVAGLSVGERRGVLVDVVSAHIAVVLGYATGQVVDTQASFMDLGFDSLAAVELRNRLVGATGVNLSATAAYDHPTPEALAEYIDTCLPTGASGADLDDALDRVASALGAATPDIAARRRITRRLRHLLAAVETAGEPETGADPDDDIRSAGIAELFDLLDGELE